MPPEIWGAVVTGGVFILAQAGMMIWGMASLVGRVKTIEKNSTAFLEVVQEDHDRVIGLEARADAREGSSKDFRLDVGKRFDKMDQKADHIADVVGSLTAPRK